MQSRTLIAGLVFAGGFVGTAPASIVSSVGVYDEETTTANSPDSTAAGSTITLADFTTAVAAAFAADRGGVWNFDAAFDSFGPAPAATNFTGVTYGVSQAGTLNIAVSGNTLNRAGIDSNALPTSGANALGMVNGGDFTLSFGQNLSAFGITVLSRNAARTVSLVFTLDNGSTATVGPEDILNDATTPQAGETPGDVFFGYQAPTGRSIASVLVDSTGFTRFDDLGFVVVPEPASLALIAAGGLLMLRRRAD